MKLRTPLTVTLVALAAGSLIGAAPAGAAFALKDLSAAPDDPAAGAHSDFRIHVGFEDPGQDVRDFTIHLAPGISGNPTVPELCTVEQFNADSCPPASQVGEVAAQTTVFLAPPVGAPSTAEGSIFNLEPQPGEPARFGIQLRPVIGAEVATVRNQASVHLRPDDFGLDTVMRDLPNSAMGVSIDINALDILLYGSANGGPFMGNPTSCAEAVTRFTATSYGEPNPVTGQASFTPTDCASLKFAPRFSATLGGPGQTGLSARPSVTTVIRQSLDEANLLRATVQLPSVLGADNAVLNQACPSETFASGSCPESAVVGSAVAASPLLPAPLTGPVILLLPPGGGLPQIGLDLTGPLSLRLKGQFALLEGGTGAIFDGLPDIAISRFALTFSGGKGGLLVNTEDLCRAATPTFQVAFLGHSGAERSADVGADVDGCGGGRGGPDATLQLRRATSEHPRLIAKVEAGAEPLRGMELALPRQLRFGKGRDWARGASVSDGPGKGPDPALRHRRREASVRVRQADGANRIVLRIRREALETATEIEPGKRLRFEFEITDADGERTSVNERVRAKR